MNIGPATLEDAFGIAKVHVRSWQSVYAGLMEAEFLERLSVDERTIRWRDILQKAESQTFVARQGASVVGFVSFGKCRDEGAPEKQGEIWALYAQPEVWGQGVGRTLMERAAQELRMRGHVGTSLWVLSQNQRAVRFYETFGFKRIPGSEKRLELGGRQVEEVCFVLNDA